MKTQKIYIDYFKELFGITVTFKAIDKLKNVPVIINSMYKFYNLFFKGYEFIVAEPEKNKITPAEFKKHCEIIQKSSRLGVILAIDNCTAAMRKQLINYKLPFIVPKKQMYLPDLLIDLREHFNELKAEKNHLTPAAQTVLLYHFHYDLPQPFTPADITGIFNFTKMTATRIITEFELHELCKCEKQGKNRLTTFDVGKQELWDRVFSLFRTPVLNTVYVKQIPAKTEKFLFKAGTSALAERSMIAADKLPVFAIGKGSYYANEGLFVPADFKEDAGLQLQIWNYDPGLLSDKKKVDILSLYLSMINEQDDRIQIALDEILKGFAWK